MLLAVPSNLPHGGLDVVRVEVGELLAGDLSDLVAGHATGGLAARGRGALLDPGGLPEQVGGRRRLEDEREGAVLEDRDLCGMIWPALSAVFSL